MAANNPTRTATATLKDDTRQGLRPAIARAYVLGSDEERAEVIESYGAGLVRRALREEAVRYDEGSAEAKAFFTLRDGVANDRKRSQRDSIDIVFTPDVEWAV